MTLSLLQGQFSECIRFIETANIVEILREAGPAGLHVDDILKTVLELRPKSVSPQRESPLTSAKLGASQNSAVSAGRADCATDGQDISCDCSRRRTTCVR